MLVCLALRSHFRDAFPIKINKLTIKKRAIENSRGEWNIYHLSEFLSIPTLKKTCEQLNPLSDFVGPISSGAVNMRLL